MFVFGMFEPELYYSFDLKGTVYEINNALTIIGLSVSGINTVSGRQKCARESDLAESEVSAGRVMVCAEGSVLLCNLGKWFWGV